MFKPRHYIAHMHLMLHKLRQFSFLHNYDIKLINEIDLKHNMNSTKKHIYNNVSFSFKR